VPDCSGNTPDEWEPALNPLHQSVNSSCACIDYEWSGPGKPFLQRITQAYPGYYVGMLQNPNNRASVALLDTMDHPCWDESLNRYSKSSGPGSLYDEIISRPQGIQAQAA